MCVCVWGSFLTEHGDVDAGEGRLALDTLEDAADVVSAVGHCGIREDQVGAHAHGGQEVCQRLNLGELEERGK